eukprot:2535755-Ditylum_brightwellii.AAC.1
MSEGMLQTNKRLPVYGLKVYSVPIEDKAYTREFLRVKGKKIHGEMECIEQKLHLSQFPEPQLLVRQCLWVLTLRCLQHLDNYICRHVSPALTKDFSKRLDDKVKYLVTTATDIGGCGLCELEDRHFAEYLGGMWYGLPPLLNTQDNDGNMVAGRLNLPALTNILGKNSFGTDMPWMKLLSHPNSTLANNLHTC